jgi:hypothetical protein
LRALYLNRCGFPSGPVKTGPRGKTLLPSSIFAMAGSLCGMSRLILPCSAHIRTGSWTCENQRSKQYGRACSETESASRQASAPRSAMVVVAPSHDVPRRSESSSDEHEVPRRSESSTTFHERVEEIFFITGVIALPAVWGHPASPSEN